MFWLRGSVSFLKQMRCQQYDTRYCARENRYIRGRGYCNERRVHSHSCKFFDENKNRDRLKILSYEYFDIRYQWTAKIKTRISLVQFLKIRLSARNKPSSKHRTICEKQDYFRISKIVLFLADCLMFRRRLIFRK